MTQRSMWKLAASVLTPAAFAGLLFAGRADAGDETVVLLPRWKVGEKASYEIVRTRRKTQPDKPVSETVARSSVEIEILGEGKDSFLVGWTHGETTFDGATPDADALAKKMADLVKGLRVEIEMDSGATITGVRNWKELQTALKKAAELLCDELQTKAMEAAAIAKVRAQMAQLYAGKMMVEQGCTRDPQRFFMALGYEFKDGKPVEYEDRLANPFGGEAFPTKSRFALRSVDRKTGIAIVDFTQTIPPEHAVRIMDKTLKDMAARMGKPVPDGEGLKSFSIEDTAEFQVDLATGWIRSAMHKRATKSGESSQEDVVTFTRKADPSAGPK